MYMHFFIMSIFDSHYHRLASIFNDIYTCITKLSIIPLDIVREMTSI